MNARRPATGRPVPARSPGGPPARLPGRSDDRSDDRSRGRSGARRSPRRRRLLFAGTAALLLLGGPAGGELTVRHAVRDRVLRAAPGLGGTTSVAVAGSALWDVTRGHIPTLRIDSTDARVGPLPHVAVRARLDDLRTASPARVGGSVVDLTVPVDSIGAAVRSAVPSLRVGAATADPQAGTVTVPLGAGGLGELVLRPAVANGRIAFPVASLTLLGREVPPDRLGNLGGFGNLGGSGGAGPLAGEGGPGGRLSPDAGRPYPLGLRATGLTFAPDSLHITLAGGPATVSPADTSATGATGTTG